MEQKNKDKSDLLNQLKIDKSDEPELTTLSWSAITTLVIFALLLGGGSSYYIFAGSNNAQQEPMGNNLEATENVAASAPEQPLESPQPIKEQNSAILNASGYITARRMATVSAQVMGLIKTVNVEEGMAVKQDQILAHLDDTIAKVNLAEAKANLKTLAAQLVSQQSSLDEASRHYHRVFNNKYSSTAEKTQSETSRDTAKAALKQVQARLEAAKIGVIKQQELLDHYTIRAPFSGVVTMKNAQPGEIVAPSSAGGGFTRTGICTIVDMDSLEIEVDVNESFIGRVYPGQKVTANLDAYQDWTIPASVIAIIPTADRSKATVSVRIKIEIKDPKILPDMGVKVGFLK